VAERIAAERGEQVGKTVGYQVGINLEKKFNACASLLMFMS
jgi:HrpA-like RNA helicase